MARITETTLAQARLSHRKVCLLVEAAIDCIVHLLPDYMQQYYAEVKNAREIAGVFNDALFRRLAARPAYDRLCDEGHESVHAPAALVLRCYILVAAGSLHPAGHRTDYGRAERCLDHIRDVGNPITSWGYLDHAQQVDDRHNRIFHRLLPWFWPLRSGAISPSTRDWARRIYAACAWDELPVLTDRLLDDGIGDNSDEEAELVARLRDNADFFQGEAALDYVCGYV